MINNSTEMDLVISGGTLVLNTGAVEGNIAVKDGKIAAITTPDVVLPSQETIDASHQLVFPGGVDPHVHFKEPGAGNVRENFGSGTRQAAAGGITTTVEMPLSDPLVTSKEAFDLKVNTANPQVVTDYALWGLLPSNELHRLEELIECGSVAFKTFLSTDLMPLS